MPGADSNTLIEQLLKAEEEAENVIKIARENRTKTLNHAHAEAEKELQEFKNIEQKRFDTELHEKYGSSDISLAHFEKNANEEIEEVKKQYLKNRDKAIQFINKIILNVEIVVNERTKRSINDGRGF
ncbi:putative vacuolar ATP synthase subunit g [Cardiosporidium cionae]|uniref:Vacuolar ATP synthase subunit g n=1 Tax=Cardiosporidium cionae TaxID=476202 RepID=A0ABQ7JD13_9APIC|nr:putative vacuolar ATP synthase subunit g [Cardiosporidium cionae]|eukprot:KAF8821515.1 putative vacuolar ATP synthase subunit g [Cardiosporidium cionae]